MRDRGEFWTPVPDWADVRIEQEGARCEAISTLRQVLLVSGDIGAFLSRHGIRPLGPRDVAEGTAYALRLAPDRVLYVSKNDQPIDLGWLEASYAVADMTDGIIALAVTGQGSLALLQQGTSYDLTATDARPGESANIVFAGLRVAVVRGGEGWRLHVERPYATALWTWLRQASSLET